ncbi:MAG: FHA domain-containing protein [Chromatiaceae bacterium]|nr:FHA domain-containing protein [Chromatiaceae bacterium]
MALAGEGRVIPSGLGMPPDTRAGRSRLAGVLPLALLTSLVAGGALAEAPASLQITQALARGTEVTAYVAVRAESGAPVAAEALGQARATLGTQVAEVASATPFAATGEGVLYILLVDLSRSLDAAQFERIRQALRDWIAALEDPDRAAILTFGNQVRTLVAPTADRAALTTALDGLKPTDDRTALHQALAQSLTLGRQQGPDLPSRRALVILSDGRDDAPGGMTAEEVEMQMAEGAVPIHAIGFSRIRERAAREAGLTALGRLARRSGGLFIDASAGDPGPAFAAMRERIRAVERLQIRCPTCVADGNRYRLQIALTQEGRTLSDGVEVRLYPPVAAAPEAAGPGTPATDEAPGTPTAGARPEGGSAAGQEPPAEATPTTGPNPTGTAQPVTETPLETTPGALPPDAPAPSSVAEPPVGTAPGAPAPGASPQSDRTWWPWLLGTVGLSLGLALLILGLRRRGPGAESSPPVLVPEARPLPETPVVFTPPPPTGPVTVTQRPAVPPGPTLTLAYMGGRRRGEVARLVLAPDGLIGRAANSALALAGDAEVSARHARFFVQERRLLLEDLGSTNGTWLNGVRLLAPTPVREGDVLRCGQTELRLTGIGVS